MTTKNSRTNPLNGATNWTEILDEPHTIEYHTDKGTYGFYTEEKIRSGSIVVYNTDTGVESGETMTIITSGVPQPNQVYPDVRNGTGFCWCNAADVNAVVLVDYEGGGQVIHEEAMHDWIEDIIEENLGATGGGFATEAEIDAAILTDNQQIVHVKDIKAANTAGGDFSSGAWRTRTLTTLENPFSVTWASLASNQITLASGTYEIEIMCPAYRVAQNKAKLYNITDAADEIIGASVICETGSGVMTWSHVVGIFTIADTKVFEVQHRCTTTKATDGFGTQSNYSVSEVYTQVKIRKLA